LAFHDRFCRTDDIIYGNRLKTGKAFFTTMLARRVQFHQAHLAEHLTPFDKNLPVGPPLGLAGVGRQRVYPVFTKARELAFNLPSAYEGGLDAVI
jgi:hypothetical protein